jgi:hypothetical protein
VTTAGKLFTIFFVIMAEPELLVATANGAYDVLVIGMDDAARETALEAAKHGLRVVLVEEGHIQANPGNPAR